MTEPEDVTRADLENLVAAARQRREGEKKPPIDVNVGSVNQHKFAPEDIAAMTARPPLEPADWRAMALRAVAQSGIADNVDILLNVADKVAYWLETGKRY